MKYFQLQPMNGNMSLVVKSDWNLRKRNHRQPDSLVETRGGTETAIRNAVNFISTENRNARFLPYEFAKRAHTYVLYRKKLTTLVFEVKAYSEDESAEMTMQRDEKIMWIT